MPQIETLKKLVYTNLETLLDDINRNFAVVENSPLYKGIPGESIVGIPGAKGQRGTQFIFVKFSAFKLKFPNQLASETDITLAYLNSKLSVFETKELLFEALNITELVNADIVVLPNSAMLLYSFADDIFVDTGIAFNEDVNLLSTINEKIQAYIEQYFRINPNKPIINIFEEYVTYAKNYADNNNSLVTNALTASSIYAPYIPGYGNTTGIELTNHSYFGFPEQIFPKTNNGTIVFGSIRKYYDLLQKTISTDGTESLISGYAPGVNNIPTAVFLQDTYKNGLLIGYKDKQNLKRFGSIYKNEIDELVFKSDSGILSSEYSELILHKNYLKYAKIVQFGNDLEVSRDFSLFGDISSKLFKTGKFTQGAGISNNFNEKIAEIGIPGTSGIVKHFSEFQDFPQYINNVFITDNNGRVSKNYSLETIVLDYLDLPELNILTGVPTAANKILTSNYFSFLVRKINNISAFVSSNYWRKNQFTTKDIPSLKLSDEFSVENIANLSGIIKTNKLNNKLIIDSLTTEDNATNKFYSQFINKLFVTNNLGKLSTQYSLDSQTLTASELLGLTKLSVTSESEFTIISTRHYAFLAKKINNLIDNNTENYWRKNQFENYDIPTLNLSDDLNVRGNIKLGPNGDALFEINKTTKDLSIGNNTNKNIFKSNLIVLSQFVNNVLVTDAQGNLLNTFSLEINNYPTEALVDDVTIPENIITETTKIPKSSHIGFLAKKINNILNWIKNNYWNKNSFTNGDIQNLVLSQNLKVDGNAVIGNDTNPNFSVIGSETTIGKTTGNLRFLGNLFFNNRPNIIVTTNSNSEVVNTFSVETITPTHLTQTAIKTNYWTLISDTFDNIANSANTLITAKLFQFIIFNFNSIRELIFDRPTLAKVNQLITFKGEIKDIYDFDGTFLTNFDTTGLGISSKYIGWALFNGNNGTPDGRGRVRLTAGYYQDPSGYGNMENINGETGGSMFIDLDKSNLPDIQLETGLYFNSMDYDDGGAAPNNIGSNITSTPVLTEALGSGVPHYNMQPYIAVYTIIRIID